MTTSESHILWICQANGTDLKHEHVSNYKVTWTNVWARNSSNNMRERRKKYPFLGSCRSCWLDFLNVHHAWDWINCNIMIHHLTWRWKWPCTRTTYRFATALSRKSQTSANPWTEIMHFLEIYTQVRTWLNEAFGWLCTEMEFPWGQQVQTLLPSLMHLCSLTWFWWSWQTVGGKYVRRLT